MAEFSGKIALVTGTADPVGRACALALATQGTRVVCAGDEGAARHTAAAVVEQGGRARGLAHDPASEADWLKLIAGY